MFGSGFSPTTLERKSTVMMNMADRITGARHTSYYCKTAVDC